MNVTNEQKFIFLSNSLFVSLERPGAALEVGRGGGGGTRDPAGVEDLGGGGGGGGGGAGASGTGLEDGDLAAIEVHRFGEEVEVASFTSETEEEEGEGE
ncbi:hypothetical protein FHG87_012387 [Trinorchestia longiramus]|nr:hypothetical protein FHG87_012387 [Trinorchestia longiramus]